MSKFIEHHPGGVDQIMYGVGRDATQLFESYHKLSVHRLVGMAATITICCHIAPVHDCRVLEKFYVGELITNEYPWFPKPRCVCVCVCVCMCASTHTHVRIFVC